MNLKQLLIREGLTQQYWKQDELTIIEVLCLTSLESINVCQAVEEIIIASKPRVIARR